MCRPFLDRRTVFPADIGEIDLGQRVKRSKEPPARRGCPEALEQEVGETEREVERGVAIPCALGIEKDGSVRADEDVFWADVSVDQRAFRVSRPRQESA